MSLLFQPDPVFFNLPDAEISYHSGFFDESQSNELLEKLKKQVTWQQDCITVFGKKHLQPRLTALYGNQGKPYGYADVVMQPHPWNPLIMFIKNRVEEHISENFSTVLLNYYRDGKDSNGWHADNEKELGKNPVIASVSFGAERIFQLKHITNSNAKQHIVLEHGSLLVMQGVTQHFWKHQIPKSSKDVGPRINLTFRNIK